MKTYILGTVLSVGIFIAPALVHAQTVGDVSPQNTISSCIDIQNNLQFRSRDVNTNGEVSLLQSFLQDKGFLNSDPTGFFGGLTLAAVKNFQSSINILSSGYAGPITRGNIKGATCSTGGTPQQTQTTTTTSTVTGCAPGANFSATTGRSCTAPMSTVTGCATGARFSSTTGQACDGTTQTATPATNQTVTPTTPPTQISVPTISYINPTSSTVGSTVYVYGLFGSNPYIQFDGKKVDTTIVPNDKITETVLSFVVPSYANVGNHSVQVDGTVGTPSVTMVGPSVTLNVTPAQQTTTSQPSVTVTYPTSGINFSPGQTISITWATSGLSSNANYTVIYSKTGGDVPIGTYTSTQAHCDASNKCYVSWTIPNITDSNISVTVFETISGKVGGSGLFSIGSAVPTISVSGGTPTAVVTTLSGQPDTGSYTIPFTVTAGDADVYISRYATRTTSPTSPTGGVNFDMTVTSTPNATSVAGETVTVSNSVVGDVGNAYKILANTSRAFTLNVQLKAIADGYDGIRLTGINYGATSALGSSYTSNLGSFKTNDVHITN